MPSDAVTRLQIRAGADWIKAMATGGVYSLMDAPDAVQFTEAEMAVMVEEAAQRRPPRRHGPCRERAAGS